MLEMSTNVQSLTYRGVIRGESNDPPPPPYFVLWQKEKEMRKNRGIFEAWNRKKNRLASGAEMFLLTLSLILLLSTPRIDS